MRQPDLLETYRAKRNFDLTSEPQAGGRSRATARSFVIQKHWAKRLHYDFRLELDGSMKSWAVPKGPSLDPHEKRLAIQVEDHPIAYNRFEGVIPPKQYGAGRVIIWDRGTWVPMGDPRKGYQGGHLKFELRGRKLSGKWALIRIGEQAQAKEQWLLIKEKDERARSAAEYSVVDTLPDSVAKSPAPRRRSPPAASRTSHSPAGAMPAAARKASLPATLAPQLATLLATPPATAQDWLFEVKFDGYRMLARVDARRVRLFSRSGRDWTDRLPELVAALKELRLAPGWLDGEIVVLDDKGVPRFQALQNAFDQGRTGTIVYALFDLPFYGGYDLRAAPLIERKRLLKDILDRPLPAAIRLSEALSGRPRDILHSVCRLGLEGLIGKRRDAAYVSRRSTAWVKLKCAKRQEFVVGGYTDPQGARTGIGSLLLGVHDDKGLHYVGKVGTGFDQTTLAALRKRLDAIARSASPFANKTQMEAKAHWVRPSLVAEVSFGEWTDAGRIRHAVFHGLRTDKEARAITRERARPLPAAARAKASAQLPEKLSVSHPDRVIDPSSGTTKLELIEYYARVAPLMMEHLRARPVALVRAPDGVDGQIFFQKHLEGAQMIGVKALDPGLDPGHSPLLEIVKPEGLLFAAQMNVLEVHTWNALKTRIDRPDRMTFDLDPGEGLAWPALQESAHLLREFLTRLELVSFLKTSGGKGLHIVVPLKRLHGWDTVKDFSRAIVQHLSATLPQRFASKSGPRNRVGRIFVDYLRNGYGATTVAAWSARSRPGLGVSVPIDWSELDALEGSAHWTVANIDTRLASGNRPWRSYAASAQSLSAAMKILGFDRR